LARLGQAPQVGSADSLSLTFGSARLGQLGPGRSGDILFEFLNDFAPSPLSGGILFEFLNDFALSPLSGGILFEFLNDFAPSPLSGGILFEFLNDFAPSPGGRG